MKRKYCFVIFLLVLAMFLSGCAGGIVTLATDEAKIKSVINEYFLALNDQNWSKAKSYCVYGSDVYYETCQMEDEVNTVYSYCNTVTINAYADIQNVSIYGNYSEAYLYLTTFVTACSYYNSVSGYGYYYLYLEKVGNAWKIYDSSD